VDLSWDALFESSGQIVEDGWTAELAIPFTSLAFPPLPEQDTHRWGFQILREIRSKVERVVWAPLTRNGPPFLNQMGMLEGLKNLPVGGERTAGMFLTGRPTVSIPRAMDPPRIDGRLDDDAAWLSGARITELIQQWPVEGASASERTEVYLAYDEANLYVGVYARYGNPRFMRANRLDRDRIARDDTVSLYFDPFLDQQRAYVFSVNGYGVQGDGILTGEMASGAT